MNIPITLKEHEKESDLQGLDLVSFRNYLKRIKLDKVINIIDNKIKAKSYVGIIKYKNHVIQILPKLISKDEESKESILKNLIYMLSFTKKLNIKTNKFAKLSKEKNPFMEVLIREFADSLFDCLKRLTPKNYVRDEDNLNYLRGKIKFSENIRYNCSNASKFYCEFDEYSENNALNQLFLFVSTCLYNISSNNKNKRNLKFIISYYSDIELVYFDNYKVDKINLTRNQELFKKPFMLAKMFLENATVDFTKTKLESITLLWNMNELFEEFVFELLKRNENKFDGWKFSSQEGRRLLFQWNKDNKKRVNKRILTKVDILAEKEEKKVIIDTKYKIFEGLKNDKNKRNKRNKNPDIYQVITYCLLHKSNHAILLYPRYGNDEPEQNPYLLNTPKGKEEIKIDFKTIDLKKDDLKIFFSENNEFIDNIKDLLLKN